MAVVEVLIMAINATQSKKKSLRKVMMFTGCTTLQESRAQLKIFIDIIYFP